MKDEKKILIICVMFAISIILFTIKASGQGGTFDKLTLKDRYGIEERTMKSTIELLPGKLKVSENGQEWLENILFQSKSIDSCEVETLAGHYLMILDKDKIKRVYLRSNAGADRIYE